MVMFNFNHNALSNLRTIDTKPGLDVGWAQEVSGIAESMGQSPDGEYGGEDPRSQIHKHSCLQLTNAFSSIGVEAQSTLRKRHFFASKMCIKINKMPEFYIIIARKIFFPIFFSYAYVLKQYNALIK